MSIKKNKKEIKTENQNETIDNETIHSEEFNKDSQTFDDELAEGSDLLGDELAEESNLIDEMQNKISQINDSHLRLQAEFDNYRKRTLKEKMELSKSAGEGIFVNLLPVIDDLERAMGSITDATDVDSVKKGMELIYSKFSDFTKQSGMTEIKTIGENFNLDEHEAITKIPAPSEDLKGKIVDCVQKGYMLNGKVIRFSKVVIGE